MELCYFLQQLFALIGRKVDALEILNPGAVLAGVIIAEL